MNEYEIGYMNNESLEDNNRDFLVWLINTKHQDPYHIEYLTSTQIQKIISFMKPGLEKKNFPLGYKFDKNIDHIGKYDEVLQDDIEALMLTGCIQTKKITFDNKQKFDIQTINITENGERYAKYVSEPKLKKYFKINELKYQVWKLVRMNESALINMEKNFGGK